MNEDILSYVQYVISQNANHKKKRFATDPFDGSRKSYKHLAGILIYNACTGSNELEPTLVRAISEMSSRIKLFSEAELLVTNITNKFRKNGLQEIVDQYEDKLLSYLVHTSVG